MYSHEVFEDGRQETLFLLNAYDELVSYWCERIRQDLDLLEKAEERIAGDDEYAGYLNAGQDELAMSYAIVEYSKELALENI